MVVKKPVVKKKRKIRKGKQTKNISKTSKGGNVSQVVNVYVSKTTRQRRAKPVRIQPQIQPQMYNAGQEFILSGIQEQNKTLLDILDKQRTADTTPNSDITSLDKLIVKKIDADTPPTEPKKKDDYVNYGGIAPANTENMRMSAMRVPDPVISQNLINIRNETNQVSNMLSSIAEGMDEIPQGDRIKMDITEISEQMTPQERVMILERNTDTNTDTDTLDEIYLLELEYDDLVSQLREQKKFDNSIKMSNYTQRLPKKVNKLKEKIAEMKNTLEQSRRLTRSSSPI
tara:strand:+ start:795 stop:1652 length:858 start_codon:yes stop_codon:yes gene_type:complete